VSKIETQGGLHGRTVDGCTVTHSNSISIRKKSRLFFFDQYEHRDVKFIRKRMILWYNITKRNYQ